MNGKILSAAYQLLEGLKDLGVKLDDNFKDTPQRVTKLFEDMVWAAEEIKYALDCAFEKTFPADYDEMLVVQDIKVNTLCPHHLLPCTFTVNIGYVPDGKVLGLSKFARIATVLAKRPILQEQYTSDLVKVIQEKLKPKGVAVYVKGRHSCIEVRGVKQKSSITTSSLTGCFKEEADCRKEFYDICRATND